MELLPTKHKAIAYGATTFYFFIIFPDLIFGLSLTLKKMWISMAAIEFVFEAIARFILILI